MDTNNALEIKNISKKFDLKGTTGYGGITKIGTIPVIKDLTLNIKKGQIVGLIGRNGSGKSTLLKIISGIMSPDSGIVETSGKVIGILELGMGFQREVSGRENIYVKCGMYGFNKNEIDEMIDEIIDFSELGEQIDHPLRTYSSGMIAKLAFSILVRIKCSILIVDEILSIGDAGFNAKCRNVFQNMKKEGKTIIIASHNMSTLEEMCDSIIWLDEGKIKKIGEPFSICYSFQNSLINSYETVLKIAQTGDVSASNRIGIMLRDGIDTGKDVEKAKEWFLKASNCGFEEAQINLANLYLEEGKRDQALELFKKASNNGNSFALIKVNELTGSETKITTDLISEIKNLVENGNLRATKLYADILYSGIVVQKDLKLAHDMYVLCANNNDVQSQFILGQMYRDGNGVQKDSLIAIQWFTEAANNGHMKSKIELANIYRKGIGTDVDMAEAIKWYTLAAKCGDSNSMYQLSQLYKNGIGIEKDMSKSEYWALRYTKFKRSEIEYQLADIYKHGYWGEMRNNCIKWYEDAVQCGNAVAAFHLGMCYRDGLGTYPDSEKANTFFAIGAERCNVNSMIELANMLEKGNGCLIDKEKAIKYLETAVKFGNLPSRILLSKIYGLDNLENHRIQIEKLLSKVSEYGYPESKALLNEFFKKMKM